ncbi:hypothetical protein HIM_04654 [Hirsutella minnesotensis 3608]|uniref:Maltose/galactoside acetyltransferase domain-containing protein n=1 Tax=Hirsutella minnesotensis 3608 TaxID=1043627 RepID=A0A0F7ZPN9_9HYPO|nr:hypothetical protein HIM_04654 [Hirsutella minnesotensis 3608]
MAARTPDGQAIDPAENRRRMARGDSYYAFTPDLIKDRRRCARASRNLNTAQDLTRRRMVELWKDITCDETPLPPQVADSDQDEALFEDYPWVDAPIKLDYGYNVKLDKGVYVNSNSTWIDTCTISVGARTIIGPNCSFYSGIHPLDYKVRNGLSGPESGEPITIGEDCWLAGNVVVLQGVTIGRGAVVGAGSVVTKDVPPEVVVVGNPARPLKHIDGTSLRGVAGDSAIVQQE